MAQLIDKVYPEDDPYTPCLDLINELVDEFQSQFPRPFQDTESLLILAPLPFMVLFRKELLEYSRTDPFCDMETLNWEDIKLFPNYEMALVLYHKDCLLVRGGNKPIVKVPLWPGTERTNKVIFSIEKVFGANSEFKES